MTSQSGAARFTIVWPERLGRLIPEGANSIQIALAGPQPTSRTVARPPSGTNTTTVSFSDLPVGDYTATATAYPTADATGIAQATGTLPLTIVRSQTTAAALTMNSTITKVEISNSGNAFLQVGEKRTLTATAKNALNQVVLVAPSQWEWSNSNPTDLGLTPTGATAILEALDGGTGTITLKDKESGKSATLDITSYDNRVDSVDISVDGSTTLVVAEVRQVVAIARNHKGVALAKMWDWTNSNPAAYDYKVISTIINDVILVKAKKPGTTTITAKERGTGMTVSVSFTATMSAGVVTFQGLADLASGRVLIQANAVSDDGSVVVGTISSPPGSFEPGEACRWTAAEGLVPLGDLPGGQLMSTAHGVSGDGSVVVGVGTPGDSFAAAFRWTKAEGMTSLGFLPGGDQSRAFGISRDGKVIVGTSFSAQGYPTESFRWTASGGMQSIGDLPGGIINGNANAASDDGRVVTGSSASGSSSTTEAFRWTASAGIVGLGYFTSSYGQAISSDGSLIVGQSGADAVLWREGAAVEKLGHLRYNFDTSNQATGISGNGEIIVGASKSTQEAAFVWTKTITLRDLRDILLSRNIDLTGWTGITPTAISRDGTTIVGTAYHNNATKGFRIYKSDGFDKP